MLAAIDVINRIMARKIERMIFMRSVRLHSIIYSMLPWVGEEDTHIHVYTHCMHICLNMHKISLEVFKNDDNCLLELRVELGFQGLEREDFSLHTVF